MNLRLAFGFLVLAGLFYLVGSAELYQILFRIRLDYLLLLFLLAGVMIWASCLKWRLFIRAAGGEVPMLHLMRLYTVGYFFNTFTPSYIGGDVARSFHLGRFVANQRDAFVATFLERFTGFLAMALLGIVFVFGGAEVTDGLEVAILSVGALALVLSLCLFSSTIGKFGFWLGQKSILLFLPTRFSARAASLLGKLEDGMQHAREDKRLLLQALNLSFFFHMLTVLNTYLAARAVGWESPNIGGLFIVVPLVLLVSMAPLTPSGLGIQEGAFLFLLQRIGASRAEGLGVGLVLRAKVMVLAALGGLLWMTLRDRKGKKDDRPNGSESRRSLVNS